jgi:hypothetical protein
MELRIEPQREPERRGEGPILIVSPKRLKIAVSQTKQTTEAVSNRIKIDPLREAFRARRKRGVGQRRKVAASDRGG